MFRVDARHDLRAQPAVLQKDRAVDRRRRVSHRRVAAVWRGPEKSFLTTELVDVVDRVCLY